MTMQILFLFFPPKHQNIFQLFIFFLLCFLLFFQVTSLIRWSFSWWPPPGTLCLWLLSGPVAPQAWWSAVILRHLFPVLEFDRLLSASCVSLLLSLALLFIWTHPASQEKDMRSKLSESPHVRKCPCPSSHLINNLAGYCIPSWRSCSLRFFKSLLHYWLASHGVAEESHLNVFHIYELIACNVTGTAWNTVI